MMIRYRQWYRSQWMCVSTTKHLWVAHELEETTTTPNILKQSTVHEAVLHHRTGWKSCV